MPYVPTDWVDMETLVDAPRLDHMEAGIVAAEEKALKGVANGYASLGADGKVPAGQLPPMDLSAYQLRSEEGAANGYASLDANAQVPNGQLPGRLSSTSVHPSTDLNDLKENGWYQVIYTDTNTPGPWYGMLQVINLDYTSVRQVLFVHGTLDIFTRQLSGSVWSAWAQTYPPPAVTPTFGSIPGEMKTWSGSTLPAQATYGKWVWADGAIYAAATYPIAAGHIDPAWKTAHGAADPGAGNFRVPDMRGVSPFGMDAMPGGADAGRIARATAIATRTGVENHVLTLAESAPHGHTVNSHNHGGGYHGHGGGWHAHGTNAILVGGGEPQNGGYGYGSPPGAAGIYGDWAQITPETVVGSEAPGTNSQGGGGAHENMPPAIFVPWIVRLDG